MVEQVYIDITRESLHLAVCGACWCNTRQEDFPKHQAWHAELDRRIAARGIRNL